MSRKYIMNGNILIICDGCENEWRSDTRVNVLKYINQTYNNLYFIYDNDKIPAIKFDMAYIISYCEPTTHQINTIIDLHNTKVPMVLFTGDIFKTYRIINNNNVKKYFIRWTT